MLVSDILDRTIHLKEMHDEALPDRARFRAIMNGGDAGLAALLGPSMQNMDSELLPAPNLLVCLLYTSPSPRDLSTSRMPSSA